MKTNPPSHTLINSSSKYMYIYLAPRFQLTLDSSKAMSLIEKLQSTNAKFTIIVPFHWEEKSNNGFLFRGPA